jgi:hypothetical protein
MFILNISVYVLHSCLTNRNLGIVFKHCDIKTSLNQWNASYRRHTAAAYVGHEVF